MRKDYDLVTVRKYDGIESGQRSWTYLTHAIVIPCGENQAKCLRDEDVIYTYGDGNEQPGDINIYSASRHDFDSIKNKNIFSMLRFIKEKSRLSLNEGGIYFDDDTKYGKRIEPGNPKIIKFKKPTKK